MKVATVECPIKGCAVLAGVYRYQARSDNPLRRRFAGKHYCRCEVHGKQDCNEYILNSESTKWLSDPKNQNASPVEAPEKQASRPVPPVTVAVKNQPVQPVRPSVQPVKPAAKQSNGWGFYQ